MSKLSTKYEPLDSIVGADSNPKEHATEAIQASFDQFGYIEPIIVDDRTGKLLSGHGRVAQLEVMRAAGQEPPENITKDWQIPVTHGVKSKDDEEAKRMLLAYNRTTEVGGWNQPDLLSFIENIELVGTGFDQVAIDEITQRVMALAAETEGSTDAKAEWENMPEYDQDDRQSIFHTVVHFASEKDADEFFKQIERDKVKSFWWPEHDGLVGSGMEYEFVADEEPSA